MSTPVSPTHFGSTSESSGDFSPKSGLDSDLSKEMSQVIQNQPNTSDFESLKKKAIELSKSGKQLESTWSIFVYTLIGILFYPLFYLLGHCLEQQKQKVPEEVLKQIHPEMAAIWFANNTLHLNLDEIELKEELKNQKGNEAAKLNSTSTDEEIAEFILSCKEAFKRSFSTTCEFVIEELEARTGKTNWRPFIDKCLNGKIAPSLKTKNTIESIIQGFKQVHQITQDEVENEASWMERYPACAEYFHLIRELRSSGHFSEDHKQITLKLLSHHLKISGSRVIEALQMIASSFIPESRKLLQMRFVLPLMEKYMRTHNLKGHGLEVEKAIMKDLREGFLCKEYYPLVDQLMNQGYLSGPLKSHTIQLLEKHLGIPRRLVGPAMEAIATKGLEKCQVTAKRSFQKAQVASTFFPGTKNFNYNHLLDHYTSILPTH